MVAPLPRVHTRPGQTPRHSLQGGRSAAVVFVAKASSRETVTSAGDLHDPRRCEFVAKAAMIITYK